MAPNEKGGVEGEGGRFRRNHCVPMPKVDSIAALNDLLADADAKDNHRRIANRARTVGADFLVEAPLLRPLPTAEFPTWLTLEPRVDRYARVTVRQCFYSVPAKLIGRRVRVRLGACTVIAFDGQRQVAVHERITVRGEQSLNLDHYLEVLRRKPGALPGATALVQARHLPAEDVIAGSPPPCGRAGQPRRRRGRGPQERPLRRTDTAWADPAAGHRPTDAPNAGRR